MGWILNDLPAMINEYLHIQRRFCLYFLIQAILVLCLTLPVAAQEDTVIVHAYGGPFYEEFSQVISCETGYAAIGTTGSNESEATDIYIVRMDDDFNCVWNIQIGGAGAEWGKSLALDSDGGIVYCGYSGSIVSNGYDVLIGKVDANGEMLWQKHMGGSDWDFGHKLSPDGNGGWWVLGETYSAGNGGSDDYLIHLSSSGETLDEWTYGDERDNRFVDMLDMGDNLLIIEQTDVIGVVESRLIRISEEGLIEQVHQFPDSVKINCLDSLGAELYFAGSVMGEGHLNMFMQSLHAADWSVFFTNIDDVGNDFEIFDMLIANDITMIGRTTAFGLGMNDLILQQRNIYGGWEVAITFGQGLEDLGKSIIPSNDGGLVFAGKRTINEDPHAVLMHWNNPDLDFSYVLESEDEACFSVDVVAESAVNEKVFYDHLQDMIRIEGADEVKQVMIYDLRGKLCAEHFSGLSGSVPVALLGSGIFIAVVDFEDHRTVCRFLH